MIKQRSIIILCLLILLSLLGSSIVLAINIYTIPEVSYPKYPALERLNETYLQVTRLNLLIDNTVPQIDYLIKILQMED